jgi:hypothetical protein
MDVVMYSSTWTFIMSMSIAKTSHDYHYLLSFICSHNNLKVKYIDTCDGFHEWMQLCINAFYGFICIGALPQQALPFANSCFMHPPKETTIFWSV